MVAGTVSRKKRRGGAVVYQSEDDPAVLTTQAIQELKILSLEIRRATGADPDWSWVGDRLKVVEDLLEPVAREDFWP